MSSTPPATLLNVKYDDLPTGAAFNAEPETITLCGESPCTPAVNGEPETKKKFISMKNRNMKKKIFRRIKAENHEHLLNSL